MDWSMIVPIGIAIASSITAYYQWRKSEQEVQNFSQNLIVLLHHTEGLAQSLREIQHGEYTSVNGIKSAIKSSAVNAEALFFGLIESKVNNKPLKNYLDEKYSEWADLELRRKKLSVQHFIEIKDAEQSEILKKIRKGQK